MLLIIIFQVPSSILPIKKLPFKVNGEGCALVQVCVFVLIDVLTDQNGSPKVSCNILCPGAQNAINVNLD